MPRRNHYARDVYQGCSESWLQKLLYSLPTIPRLATPARDHHALRTARGPACKPDLSANRSVFDTEVHTDANAT